MIRIEPEYPQSELAGTVTFVGDVVAPPVPESDWEALTEVMSPGPPPEKPS